MKLALICGAAFMALGIPHGTNNHAKTNFKDNDYHWYRQDADGYWSHKPGTTPVRLTDNSGNLILDPAEADLGIYTNFLGYFAISPWNNLYSA